MFGLFLTFLAGAASAAAAPAPREPTGKWSVNFENAQCVATRPYGTEQEPLHLVIKAPPLGDVFQLAVLRKGGKKSPEQVEATIRADEQPPLQTGMLVYTSKSSKLRAHLLNVRSADFTKVRDARTLEIRSEELNEAFSVSQLRPLLKVMDECLAELRQVWNVHNPGEERSSPAVRAKADLSRYINPLDYPAHAIRKNETGRVRFVLLIDERGRVADCTLVETSGVPILDAQTCAVMSERAIFQPARASDGKPTKDTVFAAVTWQTSQKKD